MTLAEVISSQLADLQFVPLGEAKHLHHLYADYIELMALFSNGDYITTSSFISRLSGEGASIIDDLTIGTGEEIGSQSGPKKDAEEAWSREIFSVLNDRGYLFSDKYPYEVDEGKICLKESLLTIHKIYLMLLLSSNLKYFRLLQPWLTSEFEIISFIVLENYLPTHAIVKQFGKHSDYSGTAIEKIKHLADDMGINVNENYLANISPRNNQEKGLDIVGWIPFSDNIPSMISLFGQCACGKDWFRKQNETRRYNKYYNFYNVFPVHALFVPYSLGKPSKEFFQQDEIIDNSLIFDRRRIIDLLDELSFFEALESNEIVQSFVEHEDALV